MGFEVKPPPYPLNRRAEFINTYMEKLVSWETVSTRLESAMAGAAKGEKEGSDTEDEENQDDVEPEVYLDSNINVSEDSLNESDK
ncbi:unnamed protein product [Microthlaspi erraticum]|uniref:Manganese/iron superoxide dismutase C-terminal domain-containing protein n=1 Tax=Microthlaspi erraticum TaxID=1685480 RepID=A0A6D2JUL4_9BRAS|nr:unnamed protein product [Microthlaspi erraticum]